MTQQKSYNRLTAQGADFSSHLESREDRQFVLSTINETPSRVNELILNSQRQKLFDAYVGYLRKVHLLSPSGIEHRVTLIDNYKPFKETAAGLLKDVRGNPDSDKHSDFLGKGFSASVFRLVCDDNEYAIRVPEGDRVDPVMIDHYIAGSVFTKDIPHIEQIIAASYDEGVTIAELVPGKAMAAGMTIEDVQAITDEHLEDFLDTVITAYSRNVEIDFKPTNVHHDHDKGFYIVDCGSSCIASEKSIYESLGDVVSTMQSPILGAGFFSDDPSIQITNTNLVGANLDVLRRLTSIIDTRLDGNDRNVAMAKLDEVIADYRLKLHI